MKISRLQGVTVIIALMFFAVPIAYSADANKNSAPEKPQDINARLEAMEVRLQRMEDALLNGFEGWRDFEHQHIDQSVDNMLDSIQKGIDSEFHLPVSAVGNDANTKTTSRTEVKVDALQMSDELAKDMKLTADQKKRMAEVLAKEDKLLNDDVALKFGEPGHSKELDISHGSDFEKIIDQHVEKAEKELNGTLTPDQIKLWQNHRDANRSITVSRSFEIERVGSTSNTAKKTQ